MIGIGHKILNIMIKYYLTVLVIGLGLVACNDAGSASQATEGHEHHEDHDHDGHDHSSHEHGDEAAEEGDGIHFGETIDEDGAISYQDLLTKMTENDSMPAKVVGTVSAVCQAKGCWMDIAEASENGASMKVQFKDYGFFVPKDISGRQVVMDGYAYREVTSVEELRHYAEDEGLPKEEIEKITEPVEELKFLASGVMLLEE